MFHVESRTFVMLWVLAAFGLMGFMKYIGIDGAFLAGMMGLVGIVVGYYFGRKPPDATSRVSE